MKTGCGVVTLILRDVEIEDLIKKPKYFFLEDLNRAKFRTQDSHRKKEIHLRCNNSSGQFYLFWRQNTIDPLDFSVGLSYNFPDSNIKINLIRCNGNGHIHKNKLEGTKFDGEFHIHKATERYQLLGLKAENYAEKSTEFADMEGAYKYICRIAHIEEKREGMMSLYEY
jgi:hypothetical protein